MESYVDGFVETAVGLIPRVHTHLIKSDRLGTAKARIGYDRAGYKVVPGLYCVGNPEPESPVLVTANYKLSFDEVRSRLTGIDAWILVADTRGINVWCAAGKDLFSTEEIILSVNAARLHEIIAHRELILPQLGAVGVAAHTVKKRCGFKVIYGPIRAKDLPRFLRAGNKADEAMRMVTFSLEERVALIPVEIFLLRKFLIWIAIAAFLISGFDPNYFSLQAAWERGMIALTATLVGILSGCVIIPIILSQLPWRQFWPKGALIGLITGIGCAIFFYGSLNWIESTAVICWTTTISAYLAMNFTGSTPYTSPSGVEKEMRRGIPVQATLGLIAIACWLIAPFIM